MADALDVGGFEIKSAIIRSHDKEKENDIGALIASFDFKEGMFNQSMAGSIMISDSIGFVDSFPVRGEETIEILYRDFFDEEMTTTFRVFAVEQVDVDYQGKNQSYVLKLCSPDFIKSEHVEIKKSYRGLITDQIQEIFDEYFTETEKELDKEECENERVFVIPSMTPYRAINFLSRKAFSNENPSSNFYFFETRDKYVFKTHEQLYKDGHEQDADVVEKKTFTYQEGNVSFDDRTLHMQNLISFNLQSRNNTLKSIKQGAMLSETVQIDLGLKTYEPSLYKHAEVFDDYTHADEESFGYHSDKYIEDYFTEEENATQTILIFNDSTLQEDTHYSEISAKRVATRHFLTSIIARVQIYGRNDIFPGDVLTLNIPDMRANKSMTELHPRLSGKYIVESISHQMQEKAWKMDVILLKDSLKGD